MIILKTKVLNILRLIILSEHDTNPDRPKYRPLFLEHFDRKSSITAANIGAQLLQQHAQQSAEMSAANAGTPESNGNVNNSNSAQQQYQNQEEILAEQQQQLRQQQLGYDHPQQQQHQVVPSAPALTEAELLQLNDVNNVVMQQQQQMMTEEQRQRYQSHLQLQLNQISAANAMGMQQFLHQAADNMMNQVQARAPNEPTKYQRNFGDGDFEFVSSFVCSITPTLIDDGFCFSLQLKFLSFDDLQTRLKNIDVEMEREIDDLNRKYESKRQPILDAMDAKRLRQQNLNNNNLIKI